MAGGSQEIVARRIEAPVFCIEGDPMAGLQEETDYEYSTAEPWEI